MKVRPSTCAILNRPDFAREDTLRFNRLFAMHSVGLRQFDLTVNNVAGPFF